MSINIYATCRFKDAVGKDLDKFVEEFRTWIEGGGGDYDYPLFSHRRSLRLPPIKGKIDILDHVHLAPVEDEEHAVWVANWEHCRDQHPKGPTGNFERPSSDVAVVFLDCKPDYLIIFLAVVAHTSKSPLWDRAEQDYIEAQATSFIDDRTFD